MRKDLLDFIRGIVRPTVTWATMGSIVMMLFLGINVPEWYQVMAGIIVGFWFGQRENPAKG